MEDENEIENIVNYIYFIETHEKGKKIEIQLIDNLFSLEEYKQNEIEDNNNKKFDLTVYRIKLEHEKIKKIYKNYKDIKIIVLLKDNDTNTGKFEAIINKIEKDKDIYLYNFSFKPRKTIFSDIKPPEKCSLSYRKQFEIYLYTVKNILKLERKKISYLIDSIEEILYDLKKYEFSFFIFVFNESITIKNIVLLMACFDFKKVEKSEQISDEQLSLAKSNIDIGFYDPESLMNKNAEENIKNKFLNYIAKFLLYFNYNYQKNRLYEYFNNDKINTFLYQNLLENNNLFSEIKLSKSQLTKFLTISLTYDDILKVISFSNNFLEILEVINENKNKFIEYLNGKENYKKIDLGNLVEIKNEDNMEKIKIQIEQILSLEKEINKNFVFFSRKLLKSYAEYYNENNINDLIFLIQIINLIKENDKTLSLKSVFKIIHDKIIKFSLDGKVKNMNLLIFIENDPLIIKVKDNDENENLNIPLDIFNGLDISNVNEQFINKWKKIKWLKIFKNSEKDFYNKICSLLMEMRYFGKLFLLFDIFEKEKDYDKDCLLIMQEKFINLIDTYSKEECPNIINEISDLIYFLNTKQIPLKSFILDYIYNLFIPFDIHQIYYNIYSNKNYNNFSDELKYLIFDFYKDNENKDFINPLYLIFFIQNNQNLKEEDFSLLNSFILEPLDIYDLNEVDRFLLLKKLIENKLLNIKELSNYFEFTKSVANIIIEEIIDGSIEFALIEKFYFNQKENILFERIKIINDLIKNDNNEDKNLNICQDIIDSNMNTLHQIINDLEIVEKKLKKFFPNSRTNDIKEIGIILRSIKNNEFFYYKKIKDKIDFYLNLNEINNLNLDLEKGNKFFKIFYEEKSKIYKNNDKKILEETEKEINKLIEIIKTNSFKNIDIDDLCSILIKFKNEENNKLEEEINKIIEKNNINIINKDEIINKLIIISKKDLIYDSANLFLSFIEMMNAEQEEFTAMNRTISYYLIHPKDIDVIQLSLELFKNYDIEFKEDTNYKYLHVLNLIKDKKDIIQFLLNISLSDCTEMLDFFKRNQISTEKIYCLVECKKFFNNFLNINNKDKDVIKCFINKFSESDNLESNFINLIENFYKIKKIYYNYIYDIKQAH